MYNKMLDELVQNILTLLDLPGGKLLLSVMYELLADFLVDQNYKGCKCVIGQLCEVTMSSIETELSVEEFLLIVNMIEEVLYEPTVL